MLLRVCLVALALSCAHAARAPSNTVLHAPFTPFGAAGGVNLAVIPTLAKDAAAQGVNVLWISGSMAQFDALTLVERKALAQAWVDAARPYGLFVLVHVGTTSAADAIELATHAAAIGADAIGAVPPYYEQAPDAEALAQFLAPIAAAAPALPFYYYHLPAVTHCTLSMVEFFPHAVAAIPSFAGVKFVSPDLDDYATLVATYPQLDLWFAPEPKLAGIALGARGVVLAESFFAATWLRMCHAALANNWAAARAEQAWKHRVVAVFQSFGAGTAAERAVYRRLVGVEMGAPRLPQPPLPAAQYPALIAQLDALGFFNQTVPGPCVL